MEVGDEIRGFSFIDKLHEGTYEGSRLSYNKNMDNVLGRVGVIKSMLANTIYVDFPTSVWHYPKDLAEEHLVKKTIKEIKFKLIK